MASEHPTEQPSGSGFACRFGWLCRKSSTEYPVETKKYTSTQPNPTAEQRLASDSMSLCQQEREHLTEATFLVVCLKISRHHLKPNFHPNPNLGLTLTQIYVRDPFWTPGTLFWVLNDPQSCHRKISNFRHLESDFYTFFRCQLFGDPTGIKESGVGGCGRAIRAG